VKEVGFKPGVKVPARHTLDLTVLEAVNFLSDNFARHRLILKILSRQTKQ